MRVLVTVKAYPGIGQSVGEAVCVAGVRLDGESPAWVRLWPVGFRELPTSVKFRKWQIIEVDAARSRLDRRPESFTPDVSTLKPLSTIDTSRNWRRRKDAVGALLGEMTLCGLMRAQGQPDAPSLGLVKVRPGATAEIVEGPVWTPDKELQARILASPHLFREKALAPLKPPEFQVRYSWHCTDEGCLGHQHSSCDWEVGAAALSFKQRYGDARPHLLRNFGDRMLGEDLDTYFFVGNQHQRPRSFLVLGAFYPKVGSAAR